MAKQAAAFMSGLLLAPVIQCDMYSNMGVLPHLSVIQCDM